MHCIVGTEFDFEVGAAKKMSVFVSWGYDK